MKNDKVVKIAVEDNPFSRNMEQYRKSNPMNKMKQN